MAHSQYGMGLIVNERIYKFNAGKYEVVWHLLVKFKKSTDLVEVNTREIAAGIISAISYVLNSSEKRCSSVSDFKRVEWDQQWNVVRCESSALY